MAFIDFIDFIANALGTRKWYVAARSRQYLASQGFVRVSQARFNQIKADYRAAGGTDYV